MFAALGSVLSSIAGPLLRTVGSKVFGGGLLQTIGSAVSSGSGVGKALTQMAPVIK